MKKISLHFGVIAALALFAFSVTGFAFTKGDKVDVLWKGAWYPATVEKVSGEKSYIHYTGYGKNWDEWVGPDRIRSGEKTDGSLAAGQGAEFKVGDEVRVLWKGSWYDAKVTSVNAKKGSFKITYDGYDKSWDEWVGKDRIKSRGSR